MAATQTRRFRTITDLTDLTGTILDAEKDLVIHLPQGIFKDVSALRLPARLRRVRVSDDGDPILTDLQRAADMVVQAVSDYCDEKTPETILRVKESVGVYIRNVHKNLAWRFEDLVNVRDSPNTSSAYLVGVPAIRREAFADGKLCELMPYQVALNPAVASRLGVENGQRIQLCRFPETRTMVVEVVLDDTIGRNCLGLPVGEPNLAKMLGGDCDGDCYAVRAFHTFECQAELNAVFERQWKNCPVSTTFNLFWVDSPPLAA